MKRLFATVGAALTIVWMSGCSRAPEESIERGNRLFEQGKYTEAELEYSAAEKKSPGLAEPSYRKGLVYLKQGKGLEALAALDHAYALDPNHKQAREELSQLCLRTYWNDPRKPAFLYQRLTAMSDAGVKEVPPDATSLRVKGYLAVSDQKLESAVQWFAKAVAANPQDEDSAAMLIQAKFRLGDTAGGVEAAERILAGRKDAGQVYDALYTQYLATKQIDQAESVLKRKVAALPEDASARLQLAAFYRGQKRLKDADAIVEEVAAGGVRFPRGAFLAGDFYQRQGEADRAIELYRKAIETNPADANNGWQRIIALELARGKREEALRAVESARKANPGNRLLPAQEAMIRLDDRKPETLQAAQSALEAAIGQEQSNAMLHYQLGYVLRMRGDLNAAKAALRESARLRPDLVEAQLLLSNIGLQEGNADEALLRADSALRFAPDSPTPVLARAAALGMGGRYGEARAALEQVRRSGVRADAVDREQAFLLLREGKAVQAEEIFRRVYKTIPDVRTAAGLADSLVAQRKYDQAIGVFEEEIRKQPDASMMIFGLAETLIRKGDLVRAAREYERWCALNPSESHGHRRLAEIALQRGDATAALAHANKALSILPLDADARVAQGLAYRLSGQTSQAEASYREALKTDPQNAQAANNLAYLLSLGGKNLDEALALGRKASQLVPGNLEFQDTLGFVYLKKGMASEAVSVLQAIADAVPENPTYQLHFAQALLAAGNKVKAQAVLKAAAALPAPASLKAEIDQALRTAM